MEKALREQNRLAWDGALGYDSSMTHTHRIPVEMLQGLDVHAGDTLHVVALIDSSFVVNVTRADASESDPTRGNAIEWLKTSKGSVKLAEGESADDARIEYYVKKYSLKD